MGGVLYIECVLLQGYRRTYDVSGDGEEAAEVLHHEDPEKLADKGEKEEEHVRIGREGARGGRS